MKRIHVMSVAALIAVAGTAAIAQTKPDPCAQGYEVAAPNGRMQLNPETMKRVDLNNDGNISKTEFDTACAKGVFAQGKKG